MKSQNNKCLLLNADYTPLSIIDWKKALTWLIRYENNSRYGIDIIDFYKDDYIIGTNNKKYPIPAIARTKRYFQIKESSITFSRKNLFLRDQYMCQYCNQTFDNKYLTYDHVIPKSKWNYDNGSPTTWTNIVTACVNCNRKKGDRTPKQANMILNTLPYKPNKTTRYLPIAHHLRKIKDTIPKEWNLYLPESYQ
jgi:5-methylcytosine-specific restriction endonuclease McrA